ncbi:MAG: glycerophosphodiester phosphodiesterase family protein [Pelagibacterium sp.]|jgi:glycerophosphoryl diester phosphodiesterase|uniref:glycerophosphodiester phosphodiesterase family protein n=1 Tax=Pelagibacterium sp. TaxID=1967288 RepID=UPI0032ED40C4
MTQIVGHRGGRNLWPENSLTGFRNVLGTGIDAVEFDVHLSDAGELLVIHDATLDRTAEGSGPVRLVTPEQRRSLRLKDSADTIPTLAEVLAVLGEGNCHLHVELKSDENGAPYSGLPERVAATLTRFGLTGRSHMTSFSLDVLDACKAAAPAIPRLCSINHKSAQALGLEETLTAAADRAEIIAVERSLLAEQWDAVLAIVPLDRLGAWVPNTDEDIGFWLERRTGYLTSDDPVLALAMRDKLARSA